jgi:hypothetical protein
VGWLRLIRTLGRKFRFPQTFEYPDNYKLFKTVYDKYNHINYAVACTIILEHGKWFDPESIVESVERERLRG